MSIESPIRLHWLDPRKPDQAFPPVDTAMLEPNGLLAIGGDLCVERIVRAYSRGVFPWYNPDEPILWWSPNPRTVFDLRAPIRISRRLRRSVAKADYAITLDTAFDQVIEACARPRQGQRGTWLGREMRQAYRTLGAEGIGHSVEIWRDGALIGGLYGLALGKVFFGESMYSAQRDASKIALVWLRRQLHAWGFTLMDCQVGSQHLYTLGAVDWPRDQFIQALNAGVGQPPHPGPWTFDLDVPPTAGHLPAAIEAS